MNLLFLASEINELEEAFRELQEKYAEIYLYTKWTFFILIGIVLIKIIKLILKAIDKEAIEFSNEFSKKTKKIKNEIDTDQ